MGCADCIEIILFILTIGLSIFICVLSFWISTLDKNQNNLSDQKVQNWLLAGLIGSICDLVTFLTRMVILFCKMKFSCDYEKYPMRCMDLTFQIILLILIICAIILFSTSKGSSELTLKDIQSFFGQLGCGLIVAIAAYILFGIILLLF